MKKTVLAIAFAVAAMPLMSFAAQAPATGTPTTKKATTTKKHKRAAKKSTAKTTPAANAGSGK